MANNLQFNVYQINQRPINVGGFTSQRLGFPTTGIFFRDCSQNLTTRSLSTGFNVYSLIQDPLGNQYYIGETFAALALLIG